MTREELLAQVDRLIDATKSVDKIQGTHVQICEFFRSYVGEESSFYKSAVRLQPFSDNPQYYAMGLSGLLESFHDYVVGGLLHGNSPEYQARLDVVSDFLEMAGTLLDKSDVHPAAPAVLIGATLEEFLRNWIEKDGLDLGEKKTGIESYSQTLRDANKLTKQDGKDITSWAGVRNHSAHGEWDEVSDRSRIRLMLEGVNLFMRKHSS